VREEGGGQGAGVHLHQDPLQHPEVAAAPWAPTLILDANPGPEGRGRGHPEAEGHDSHPTEG